MSDWSLTDSGREALASLGAQGFDHAGGGTGVFVPLTNGTISSPVTHVDVTLPTSGYLYLKLSLVGWLLASGAADDSLVGEFSYNGGVTFISDTVNNDSYIATGGDINTHPSQPVLRFGSTVNSELISTDKTANGQTAHMDIYNTSPHPWTNVIVGAWWTKTTIIDDTGYSLVASSSANSFLGYINPGATIAPPSPPANVLRIKSLANQMLISGTWSLIGVLS